MGEKKTRDAIREIIERGARQEAENWKLAMQLGKEQGLREAQALAVSFLRSRGHTMREVGEPEAADHLYSAADKLSEMKFLTIPEPTVMTPDRPTGEEGETVPGYASHILQQYIAEVRGTHPPTDALDQYQLEMLRYWMSHLEHTLHHHLGDEKYGITQDILREFIYGAIPHPYDAKERERLATLARDAIGKTTRTRYTP